jgi:hypothetical protein
MKCGIVVLKEYQVLHIMVYIYFGAVSAKNCYIVFVGDLNITNQEDGRGHERLLDVANIYNL